MTDIAVRVQDVSKRYRIGAARHDTLRDQIAESITGWIRRNGAEETDPRDLWALQDVSFRIDRGEVVGIIGRNGAGKSTLLKVLSQITEPTKGRIELFGRVGSLLEVGAGFHPELTGRENVYFNGAVLGMTGEEIDRKFDEIVAFAEVEKFLDTPVKRYSSGMYVRLAFAVAAHLEPEILVVDEVLSVGDSAFQRKCLGKMGEVASEGRTVLFVSHNMGAIQKLCTRGILLNDGEIVVDDDVSTVVSQYLGLLDQSTELDLAERADRRGRGAVRLHAVNVSGGKLGNDDKLMTGSPATFHFELSRSCPGLAIGFTLYNHLGVPIVNLRSSLRSPYDGVGNVGDSSVVCEIPQLLLLPGRYRVEVAVTCRQELEDHLESATNFEVYPGLVNERPVLDSGKWGNATMPHRWSLPSNSASTPIEVSNPELEGPIS